MKLYLSTFALTLMLAFIADIRVSISPFSITLARPWLALGIILIMCGCLCLKAQWYGEGYKQQLKEDIEKLKEDKK